MSFPKIKFSRHANRRIKLYDIPEEVISELLRKRIFHRGKQEVIQSVSGFTLPLKVVFDEDAIVVFTAYPLKKGKT